MITTARTKQVSVVSVASLLLFSSLGVAQDLPKADDLFTKWGEADGWTIFVDETRGTCIAERSDAAENVLQMGVNKETDLAYLGVFTKNDLGLEDGQEPVVLDINGKIYTGEANRVGANLPEGYTGGYVLANNPNFVEDVMKQYEMTVFPEKENAFVVSLDGTLKAIEAGRECNAAQ